MYKRITFFLLLIFFIYGCSALNSPKEDKVAEDSIRKVTYENLYDPISDQGQYYMPEIKNKPKRYWSCIDVMGIESRNNLGEIDIKSGLQYHLMCQSLVGLTNRAVNQGKSDVAVWLYDHANRISYSLSKKALDALGVKEQGRQNGLELASNNYEPSDGVNIQVKNLFNGFVLTDIANNSESGIVASVASHVFNSIIVDVRDSAFFQKAGYKMTYDASKKSTANAWHEFKDKCSNKALVIMPVQTGELRDFAIENNLFVLDLNKIEGTAAGGQNIDLLKEILAWLEPNAPVFGWEQGVSEDSFVNLVSKSGHSMIPSDWCYNLSLTSLLYSKRQQPDLTNIIYPKSIDYSKKKNFVSFFLSDGDNIQWMMNNFIDYYKVKEANDVKMSFGMPASVLTMMAPSQFDNLMSQQQVNCSMLETLGGGYYYIDNYSENSNRQANLKIIAQRLASHMRQHRIKLLGIMAQDVKSISAKEAYQAYVNANDELEGIIALQYSPYAGGAGSIIWVTNKVGYDIPVITVKYSLWNFGNRNTEREGTPAYIAGKLKSESLQESYSVICVHAWSNFSDNGKTTNSLIENQNGNIYGAGAAKLCADNLNSNFEVVNLQELVWRLRMKLRPKQTIEIVNNIK